VYDDARNKNQCSRVGAGTGCHGMYLLARKMPVFDRVEQTMPDTMHTVAVEMKHFH